MVEICVRGGIQTSFCPDGGFGEVFYENSGRGGRIWSSFCPNGRFREAFVKKEVAVKEFGVLSVQMAFSETYL